MMLCALLPNCLHLAPSLSYDSVILALGFALIAQLLYLAYGTIEKVDVKNILLTALLAAVLAPSKYACYLVAALLVFLIPHERFSRKRGRTLFFLLLIAIGLASLLLFHADALAMALGKDVWIPRDASRYDEGGYNITLVLQHPLKVIWLILYTAVSGARDLVLGMAGKTLGFSAIQIDLWIIDGFLLCLLAARLCQRDELRRNYCRRERRILLLPLPLCLLFFLFGMLLWETGFDSDRIAGVQGRYLLPLLPAAMLAIPPFSLQICGAEDVCDPGKRVSWRHLLLTAVILQSAAVLNQLAQVLAK